MLGLVNEMSDPRDVVLCAAGSMPGDLHKLWRVRERKAYHVEYGYSCMGYEVPASLGIRLADETRDVFAMVGDGGYLMMPTELVTAVQERIKVIVVLVQNHGFHSIGSLSEELGSQRFGTRYRYRDADGRLEGDVLPVDLAANARSLGVHVIEVASRDELAKAIRVAKQAAEGSGPIVIHVNTDPTDLRARQPGVVGRPGQPGRRARIDPRRLPALRGTPEHPEDLSRSDPAGWLTSSTTPLGRGASARRDLAGDAPCRRGRSGPVLTRTPRDQYVRTNA